jgi:hypothetical protein
VRNPVRSIYVTGARFSQSANGRWRLMTAKALSCTISVAKVVNSLRNTFPHINPVFSNKITRYLSSVEPKIHPQRDWKCPFLISQSRLICSSAGRSCDETTWSLLGKIMLCFDTQTLILIPTDCFWYQCNFVLFRKYVQKKLLVTLADCDTIRF